MKINKKVEVLAPAGSYEIMKAVINAGADAVYLGGDSFGARAFAGNLNKEELLKAIDYAHIRDRKIYLTVNTLLKEHELGTQLIEYLKPFYEAGLDAVIVQDMGVFKLIMEHFPDMPIHASTQMTITGAEGAKILENLHATRVVTARELKLDEIKAIHNSCNIEIESFVHGALCYCYSGQCLLSSMNGGRSGNRGRCAQPCRMEYDVYDSDGSMLESSEGRYVLSPKDMCAIKILPDIIDAGVYSLKIEGRMKNVTYAAAVTALYRKYVDMYLEYGRKGYKVDDNDINDLMDLYNRGAFTTGYYNSNKGMQMMSVQRPNHMGTRALEVMSNVSGRITFKALEQINPQDVFEIDRDNSFSSGDSYKTGQTFEVNLPKRFRLCKGRVLYRTRNGRIVKDTAAKYTQIPVKKKIDVAFYAQAGQKANIMLTDSITGLVSYTEGEIVSEALKQPLSKDKIIQTLSKTGDTPFECGNIVLEMADNIFIPMGQLNELRRNAFHDMEDMITAEYRREYIHVCNDKKCDCNYQTADKKTVHYKKSVMIMHMQQLEGVYEDGNIDDIYYNFSLFEDKEDIYNEISRCHNAGKRAVLVLPHITTQKTSSKVYNLIMQAVMPEIDDKRCRVDAVMVRNMQQIGIFAKIAGQDGYTGTTDVITDACMYIWNTEALKQFDDIAKLCGLRLIKVTLPYELTSGEMADINKSYSDIDVELVVYTRIPVMISEQCVRKTKGICDHSYNKVVLQDIKKRSFTVQSICSYCYSIMYDSKRLNIAGRIDDIKSTGADYLRYELIDENKRIDQINAQSNEPDDMESGHFIMGVE